MGHIVELKFWRGAADTDSSGERRILSSISRPCEKYQENDAVALVWNGCHTWWMAIDHGGPNDLRFLDKTDIRSVRKSIGLASVGATAALRQGEDRIGRIGMKTGLSTRAQVKSLSSLGGQLARGRRSAAPKLISERKDLLLLSGVSPLDGLPHDGVRGTGRPS